jgi:hypothetical protein
MTFRRRRGEEELHRHHASSSCSIGVLFRVSRLCVEMIEVVATSRVESLLCRIWEPPSLLPCLSSERAITALSKGGRMGDGVCGRPSSRGQTSLKTGGGCGANERFLVETSRRELNDARFAWIRVVESTSDDVYPSLAQRQPRGRGTRSNATRSCF